MPIIKPFLAARRHNSTIIAGTGTGATFNILATACTDGTGAAATCGKLNCNYCSNYNSRWEYFGFWSCC